MYNTGILKFKKLNDDRGNLVFAEALNEIPFSVKRIYYMYGVDKDCRRGFHSHNKLNQALICIHGSVKILVKNHKSEEIIELNEPSEALFIGPMIWREMYDFSEDAVLLVLASEYHNEDDYIRDYDEYLKRSKDFFG